jgi:hypothetical protein
MAAASLAPFCLLAMHGAAMAQTTYSITSSTTAPVDTLGTLGAAGGNLDIASGGSVNPTVTGPAVNLDSQNAAVTVEGSIGFSNVDGAVGIQAQAGTSGSITNTGAISIGETFAPGINKDGFSYEPYAQGTGRYGIETVGAFTGGISAGTYTYSTSTGVVTAQTYSGSIDVTGNNSYGIFIGGGLAGGPGVGFLNISGTVTVSGDNSVGVWTQGEITGGVQINNTVSVHGEYTTGVQTTGPIDGSLTIYSTVTSTGYASATRPTTSVILNDVQGTPSQIEQSGSALVVQGSVGGGIFLGAPPANTVAGTASDLDGDGVPDGAEGTAAVETFGSAPAFVIGGASPITIGQFGSCIAAGYGPGDNCFGLIVEGVVAGDGIYDNVSGTGLQIGGYGGTVNISGGIRISNTGNISASAYQNNATAMILGSGAITPLIQNEGTITATLAADSGAHSASALIIQSGASVPTLLNYGTISALSTGDAASAYAVVDQSGTVSTVLNQGTISVSLTPTIATDATTGSGVALNLSNNTTGVTLTQSVGGPNGGTPSIVGDVLLSQTGPNNVQLLAGTVTGALSLGSGTGSQLTINNGASYQGALTYTGTGLTVSVPNGTLQDNSPTTITGPSLSLGASGKLVFAIDPQHAAGGGINTQFNVGTATIANGASLGATFVSAPAFTQVFTVIKATSLTTGATSLAVTSPYLFNTTAQANPTAGTVTLTVQPKTPAQLGMNKAEAAAYPAIYASLGQDASIENALINAPTASTFDSAYRLMLPDSAGDVFQVVTSMSKAVARASIGAAGFDGSGSVARATTDDSDEEEDYTGSQGGLWASEYIIGINQNRADNEAYRAVGLGLIGGLDFDGYGADISFASSNVVKPHDPGDSIVSISRLEAGLYAAPQFGILHTEARVAAGFLRISERREFAAQITGGDLSTVSTVARTANASWNGYDLSARLGASAPFDVTQHFFVMPQAHLDVFDVQEAGYTESGGGQGFDYKVGARNSTQTSVTAGVVSGLHFGSTFVFKPQLELGWEEVVNGGPGATNAQFVYGGPHFSLPANAVSGGAGVVRLQLNGDGEFVHFAVEAGGEFRSDYQNADIRAVFRVSY